VQINGLIGDVEVRQRRIVPKQPIAFGREQHRNGYIGIGLQQMKRNVAYVKDPFLVLTKAVERLIRRREKLLLHLERVRSVDCNRSQFSRLAGWLAENRLAIRSE